MASVKKVKGDGRENHEVEEYSDDSYSDNQDDVSDSGSESSAEPEMEFDVDFEARNIEDGDFHGIRRLLQQLFLKADVNLSALTQLAIAQSAFYGSTIKMPGGSDEILGDSDGELPGDDGKPNSDGDGKPSSDGGMRHTEQGEEGNAVYGVTTFIPLTPNQDHSCVQQLQQHLVSQCKVHSGSNLQQLSDLLHHPNRPIGLLINERFLNLPVQVSTLVLQSLLKELSEHFPSINNSSQLVIVIARSHLVLSADVGKKRKNKASGTPKEQQIFDYFENEIMLKDCLLSFSYPVSNESDEVFGGKWSLDDTAMKPFRTVMVLPYLKLESVVASLEKLIS